MPTSTNGPEPVATERCGASLILTIDRAAAGNSIDFATAEALSRALTQAEGDTTLRAVVVAGAGGKFFCTGGDLKAYRAIATCKELERVFGRVRALLDQIEAHPQPVLAAIDGYALGGGLELALACDLRFASASSKLGMPQGRLGIIPGWNGIERLVRQVGRSRAFALLCTGETLTAADAHAIGLVDEIASESALDLALAFAARLFATAPLALAGAKTVTAAVALGERAAAREAARETFERLWFTDDHREAERAFVEKRPPTFAGR